MKNFCLIIIILFNITCSVFQNKIPGIGFLKIHAPWNVLCREAEFMKLKMPTKKVWPAFRWITVDHWSVSMGRQLPLRPVKVLPSP
jgi:hypothetical protein